MIESNINNVNDQILSIVNRLKRTKDYLQSSILNDLRILGSENEEQFEDRIYRDKKSPDGESWKGLSTWYLAFKIRAGYYEGIGERTGEMVETIKAIEINQGDDKGFYITSNPLYAMAFHEQRPVWAFSDKQVENNIDFIVEKIMEKLDV